MRTILFSLLLTLPAFGQFPYSATTGEWLNTNSLGGVNIGSYAGNATPSIDAIRIGFFAGAGPNASLTSSIAIGRHAFYNAHADQSFGFGHAAGQYAGLGGDASSSIIGGYLAGRNANQLSPHYGFLSVVFGYEAVTTTKSFQASAIVGARGGSTAVSAVAASMLGYGTGQIATNADFSTLVGYSAGGNAAQLTNCIYLGSYAGYNYSRVNTLIIESNPAFTGTSSLIYGETDTRLIQFGATKMGFFGTPATAKPTITGSRASGAVLQDLLLKLSNLGLINDSTTP